jgi:hypothetical protein
MKQTKQPFTKIQQTVRKLTLQQLTILGFLALMAISYWWIKVHESSAISWDDSQIKLPSTELLQQQIDQQLREQSQITNAPGDNSDRIIDPQAMQIKLTGLTKNITTEKVPSTQELEGFFQKNKQQYREQSFFQLSQIIFTHTKHGGQAKDVAKQALSDEEIDLEIKSEAINLNSVEIDDRYGSDFSQKLIDLYIHKKDDPTCWQEPITSKVGAHLICFKQVKLGAIPSIASIRSLLINDWRYAMTQLKSQDPRP